jgi:hypothetical protein
VAFDDENTSTIAAAFGQLETEIDDDLDLEATDLSLRSLTPADLAESDVEGVTHPDRDPALALPVALAATSPWPVTEHDRIALLHDVTPTEPNSPDKYDRSFLEGEECYPDCEFLRSSNDLIKTNPLMTVPFILMKDWRAFELEDGRAARASRGWMEQGASSDDGGVTIQQSYAIEMWLERDEGSLHLLVLWAETVFENADYDDALIQDTTRLGMDALFDRHDEWIEENPG